MTISYSIENLRSIQSMPEVEMRPITIVVGKNSAGKSTFLRSLLLIRQSLEVRASSPVLWFGEHVDFGDFQKSVFNGNQDLNISFNFTLSDFEIINKAPAFSRRSMFYAASSAENKVKKNQCTLKISVGSHGDRTVTRKISYYDQEGGVNCEIFISKEGGRVEKIAINDVDVEKVIGKIQSKIINNTIFTSIYSTNPNWRTSQPGGLVQIGHDIRARLFYKFRERAGNRISSETVHSEIIRIFKKEKLDFSDFEDLSKHARTRKFSKIYDGIANKEDIELYDFVWNAWAISKVSQNLRQIGESLSALFRGVKYIGPTRVSGERFYRRQELEVSEISPDGRNLAMFLSSLSKERLSSFSSWVYKFFGYHIGVSKVEGHVSLEFIKGDSHVNIADTGYGVSQLLPILAQIWWATSLETRDQANRNAERWGPSYPTIPILVEQPEVHLHPAHQARMADVFVQTINDLKSQGKDSPEAMFVIETHSEALINRLGELIHDGEIAEDKIQIVVFDNDNKSTNNSSAILSHFDEDGVLCDWPYGFFNYE